MTLVVQAYGRADIVRQAQFCVASLLRVIGESSPIQILIYTDTTAELKKFFTGFPRVEFVTLTTEDIQRYRGAIDFVHRVKVEILRDAAKRHPDRNLFYVDGDTEFLADPANLFSQVSDSVSLMHIAENAVDQGRDLLSKKLTKFLRRNRFSVGGREMGIPTSTVMFNAGALGISKNNMPLLSEVLEWTDVLYAAYQKHIMEQLAFSYVLQTKTRVITAEKIILHYWPEKNRYQAGIDEFLAKCSTAAEAIRRWNEFVLPPEPAKKPRWSLSRLFRISP